MIAELIKQGLIAQTLEQLRQKAAAQPSMLDRIEACETEFRYMCDFMLKGFSDPKRGEMFCELKKRLMGINYDLNVLTTVCENVQVKPYLKASIGTDVSTESLQTVLLDDTLTSEQHFNALFSAFIAILTSRSWTRQDADEWAVFLQSDRVSRVDVATIISALTLSTIENFSKEKTLCLATIYNRAKDELVRQRAFIGAVLALGIAKEEETQEITDMLIATSQGKMADDLIEVRMQMMSCANVDNDSREIRSNIIPNIIKNQPFQITRNGIIEKDASQEDYDPEAENKNIDAMEKSVEKMLKMQKNGADIFFEGFSQMKRFPFFQKPVNWFVPFYSEHPDIASVGTEVIGSKFVERVTKRGPFCESDKYSFVIAMSKVVSQMPENVRSMMKDGDLGPIGMHAEGDDMQAPSFVRLQYLQDLYRFYRLSPMAAPMHNPFSHLDEYRAWTAISPYVTDSQRKSLCLYILKKDASEKTKQAVTALLGDFADKDCFDYYYCQAEYAVWMDDYSAAVINYQHCLERKANHTSCMRGIARAYYLLGDYEKAASYYDALRTLYPQRTAYLLNYCMAMVMHGKADVSVAELYRLYYENPNEVGIANTLLWALLYAGKKEQAQNIADKLSVNQQAQNNFSAAVNTTYAYIANGKVQDAVAMLRKYADTLSENDRQRLPETLSQTMFSDSSLLAIYAIGQAEQAVIINLVMCNV